MVALALDPLAPDPPLAVARLYVGLIHRLAERHGEPLPDDASKELGALAVVATRTLADVRFDAERLLYLAERAALDGFPVHEQLITIAEAHEAEIKRLGSQVLGQYRALIGKLPMAPRNAAFLRRCLEAAEQFQDGWLGIARQMRHRALAIGRRELPRGRVVVATEVYLEQLAHAFGEIDSIDLRPTVAGDMILYELVVPLAPALCDDAEALTLRESAVHDAVEAISPWLVGAVALRYVPAAAA